MGKELKRVLGFWDAVATGLAAVIGAGITSCLALTLFLPLEQWIWALVVLALGIIYLIIWKFFSPNISSRVSETQ